MQKGCGREILKMSVLSALSILVLLMLWQLCLHWSSGKSPMPLCLGVFSFASFFFPFSQSLKSCLALQVFKTRKWTSQERAAEVMRERTDQEKNPKNKNQQKAIKKEEGNRNTQNCGHWSNMMDKGGRRVISVLLILFLLLRTVQHRAQSLQPMQWQKYYFKVCLFSNQLSNSRFSSPGFCLAPGGHLWLLQPSDCAAIQEEKRPGQMPKKEMLPLLSPEVFPNPRLSLAWIYEKEMTLEEEGHLCLFQRILTLKQYFLWKERLWRAQTCNLPHGVTTAMPRATPGGDVPVI